MPRLIIMTPDGEPRTLELTEDSATIGRAPENTVTIDDIACSRRQCQILRIPSGFEIVDLKSRNGTKVNGVKRGRHLLQDGDVIEIGGVRITFREREGAEEEVVLEDVGRESEVELGGDGYLLFSGGERDGERIVLSGDRTTFGRKDTNRVVLKDQMVSSYHCEIVREEGGYVLRDLGSTNGSIVNGEPVSETALSHGARIRLGRTRFVFVDPAVADYEKALAAEEGAAEADWGMMRAQVDMARVRRARRASLAWLLAFVVVLGGVAAFFALNPDLPKRLLGVEKSTYVPEVPGNLLADGSFEAHALAARVEEGVSGSADVAVGPSHLGKAALRVLGPEKGVRPVVVRIGRELPVAGNHSYDFSVWAKSEVEGTAAAAGIRWRMPGDEPVFRYSLTPWVTAPAWTVLRRVVTPPEGASRAQVIFLVDGPGSGRFDDVVFRPGTGQPDRREVKVKSGEFVLAIGDTGTLAVLRSGRLLLWNGGLGLLAGDGRMVRPDLSMRADTVEAEGGGARIRGSILLPGARKVAVEISVVPAEDRLKITGRMEGDLAGFDLYGLCFEVSHTYIGEGATLSGESGARSIQSATDEKGVRKLILGGGGNRISVVGAEPFRLKLIAGGTLLLACLARADSPELDYDLVTDFTGERSAAQAVLVRATGAKGNGRLGEAIRLYDRVVNEFPFDESRLARAEKERDSLISEGEKRLAEAGAIFTGAKGFFDEDDLERARANAVKIAEDYAGHEIAAKAATLAEEAAAALGALRKQRYAAVLEGLRRRAEDFRRRGMERLAGEIEGRIAELTKE